MIFACINRNSGSCVGWLLVLWLIVLLIHSSWLVVFEVTMFSACLTVFAGWWFFVAYYTTEPSSKVFMND